VTITLWRWVGIKNDRARHVFKGKVSLCGRALLVNKSKFDKSSYRCLYCINKIHIIETGRTRQDDNDYMNRVYADLGLRAPFNEGSA
jgi:hypothetical protein